jgi:hypothetical protein
MDAAERRPAGGTGIGVKARVPLSVGDEGTKSGAAVMQTIRTARSLRAVRLAAWGVLLAAVGSAVAQEAPRGPARPLGEPPPATQPTTNPTAVTPADSLSVVPPATRPAPVAVNVPPGVPADMARHFSDLASADPTVREAARIELMGLPAPDLLPLRQLAAANLPLDPEQTVALRDIVLHVYMAGLGDAPRATDDGFLGVKLSEVTIGPRKSAIGDGERDELPNRFAGATTGVVIVERMPGFCGARMLRNGDVIVGIAELPEQSVLTTQEMRDAVRRVRAGQTATFILLRQGRIMRVPVKLDRRPEELDFIGGVSIEDLIAQRRAKATEYWTTHFAPLLKEHAG